MKLKSISGVLLLLFVVLVFISCNKNSEESFSVHADVYYINQIIDNEVNSAIAYYAFGNKEITAATVTQPGGGSVELARSQSIWFTWFKEPEIEEYTVGYPPHGTYNFEVTSDDGEVLQSSDELDIDTLDIPVITEFVYSTSNLSYEVSWEEIEKAHAFKINIKNDEGKFIYSSLMFTGDEVTSFEVVENSGNWVESPIDGEVYTFQVQAIRFDNDANQNNYLYNFEEISIGEANVIWGF